MSIKNIPANKDLPLQAPSSSPFSEWDLKNLGLGDIAYVRSYSVSGKTAYVLHAADGSVIDAESSEQDAMKNAHFQDLSIVSVH